jgi:hypothetical protein
VVERTKEKEIVMSMWIPVAVALAGALIYGFAGNSKAQELGRLAFAVGLFWTLALFAQGTVHFLGR